MQIIYNLRGAFFLQSYAYTSVALVPLLRQIYLGGINLWGF